MLKKWAQINKKNRIHIQPGLRAGIPRYLSIDNSDGPEGTESGSGTIQYTIV